MERLFLYVKRYNRGDECRIVVTHEVCYIELILQHPHRDLMIRGRIKDV